MTAGRVDFRYIFFISLFISATFVFSRSWKLCSVQEKKPVEGKRCCLCPPLMTGSLQYRLDALPVVLVLSMSCRALAFYFHTGLEIEIRG